MRQLGISVIFAGTVLIILGVFFTMGGNLSWLGKLPGDIRIARSGFYLYLPVTTSILISIFISLVVYVIRQFR